MWCAPRQLNEFVISFPPFSLLCSLSFLSSSPSMSSFICPRISIQWPFIYDDDEYWDFERLDWKIWGAVRHLMSRRGKTSPVCLGNNTSSPPHPQPDIRLAPRLQLHSLYGLKMLGLGWMGWMGWGWKCQMSWNVKCHEMLMLMLDLWPQAEIPGVTHFGANHRPPDGHF